MLKKWGGKPPLACVDCTADIEPCPNCGHVNEDEFRAFGTNECICRECGAVLLGLVCEPTYPREQFNPPFSLQPRHKAASDGSYLEAPGGRCAAGKRQRAGGDTAGAKMARISRMSTRGEGSRSTGYDVLDRACGTRGISEAAVDCAREVLQDVLEAYGKKKVRVGPWAVAALFYGCKLTGYPRKMEEIYAVAHHGGAAVTYKQFAHSVDAIPLMLHDKSYRDRLTSKVLPLDSIFRTLDSVLLLEPQDLNRMRRVLMTTPRVEQVQRELVHMHQPESVLAGLVCWAAGKTATTADLSPAVVGQKLGISAATIKKVVEKCAAALDV